MVGERLVHETHGCSNSRQPIMVGERLVAKAISLEGSSKILQLYNDEIAWRLWELARFLCLEGSHLNGFYV